MKCIITQIENGVEKKYLIDNPIYKKYKAFQLLSESEKSLIPEEQKQLELYYYCIENNKIIDIQKERKDFLFIDNCRVATQEEIDKFELETLKTQIIDKLLEDYMQSKENAILTAQGQKINFIKNLDDAINELMKRISAKSIIGLELLQTVDNLQLLQNKSVELMHTIRTNVEKEQEIVAGKRTLKTLKEYKPTLKVVFDEKIEILDLLK